MSLLKSRSYPALPRDARPARLTSRLLVAAALTAAALAGNYANAAGPEAAEEPVWKEVETPSPPAFNAGQLIDIDVGPNVALRYGVDPGTVAIGNDGVIRYVVVASSANASAALYEGIRCATGEVKTYARFNDGKWDLAKSPEWRSLFNNSASRHSLALARQGACDNSSPAQSVRDMVQAMKAPRAGMAH
ncbi:MAG: hypothetical protein JWQ88_1901 [Rhodoferax sp.]|nr:hypothetical protein [Rhodoferax sp.]